MGLIDVKGNKHLTRVVEIYFLGVIQVNAEGVHVFRTLVVQHSLLSNFIVDLQVLLPIVGILASVISFSVLEEVLETHFVEAVNRLFAQVQETQVVFISRKRGLIIE